VVNLEEINDSNVKNLAKQIYDLLSTTGKIALFEILGNDVYCQIGEGDSFTFSVALRGDEAGFFLSEMNFSLSNNNNYEEFRNNILAVIKSSLKGNYQIETVRLGEIILSSLLVFENTLRIRLYKNLLSSALNIFSAQVKKVITIGKPIS
jgi:hypothetical protein